MPTHHTPEVTRRGFINTTIAGAAGTVAIGIAVGGSAFAEGDQAVLVAEIAKQHDATVQALRDWIALPAIAAEKRGYPQGTEYLAKLAREAGFTKVVLIPTKVNMTGGYDPRETPADSKLIKAMVATYRQAGLDPLLWPRLAGSWPGVTFTGAPLKMPAGQFGLGTGAGAHAPDEFWLIESLNPKVAGMDGAVKSYVDLFYSLA